MEEAIHAVGFWLVGVNRSIHNCVACRRVRGPTQTQKMADLPVDRLCVGPAFTNISLNVFGPWPISSCRA